MRDGGGRQDTRAVDSVICSGSVLNLPIIGARGSRQIINGGVLEKPSGIPEYQEMDEIILFQLNELSTARKM